MEGSKPPIVIETAFMRMSICVVSER